MDNDDEDDMMMMTQVMMREDSTGGWVPLGGGGLSHVAVRKRKVKCLSHYFYGCQHGLTGKDWKTLTTGFVR